jgi:hypothetical protein
VTLNCNFNYKDAMELEEFKHKVITNEATDLSKSEQELFDLKKRNSKY